MFFRKKTRFRQSYGQIPDLEYYTGDMQCIRSFYDACRAENKDDFYIDDATWNDLDMDNIYQRINAGLSTAGEQYLYYMLRRPMNADQFSRCNRLIDAVGTDEKMRLQLQKILHRIGSYRSIDVTGILRGCNSSALWLIIYILLALLLPVSIILTVTCGLPGAYMMIACLIVNGLLHEIRLRHCERDIRTANYCVSLAASLRRIRRLKHPELDRHLADAYPHLGRLRSLLRIGSVISPMQSDVIGLFMTFMLFDLITFELLKNRLSRYTKEFFVIHEAVGQIDAAIAIASFRKSLPCCAIPQIDFCATTVHINAQQVVHPLIREPVPNNVQLDRSLLVTGSNASGKSTYLKTAALCALLAQTICTVPASAYRASPFRIYTSMAITDHLQAGESYYISEIKSLKRILSAPEAGWPVLCAIDEVLRGTNTIERIAASAEILKALSRKNALCLVATHDAELCALVESAYGLAHFQESVTDHGIHFDYLLRPGMATTRNAINLLRLIGFDGSIVDAAHRRAHDYLRTGRWTPSG